MKIMSTIVVVLMLMSVPAMAQEDNTKLTDPGTTPDSFFYFLDIAMDNLALAMTFNSDDKIEKELEIAEERLAEARAMAENGDIQGMQDATDEHGKILSKLKVHMKDIENGDSEGELEKEIKIQQKIKEHSDKIEDVKNELKIKIKIKGEITPEQQEMIDSIIASLEGQTSEVEIEIKNEKSKTKIKIEMEPGKDGDEVETEIENELGITEKMQEDAQEEIDDVQHDLNETLEKYSKKNVTVPADAVDEINDLLDQARTAYDAGEYEEAEELAEQADDLLDELDDGLKESEDDDEDDKDEVEVEVEVEDHDDESDYDESDDGEEDDSDDDDSTDNASEEATEDETHDKSDDLTIPDLVQNLR